VVERARFRRSLCVTDALDGHLLANGARVAVPSVARF